MRFYFLLSFTVCCAVVAFEVGCLLTLSLVVFLICAAWGLLPFSFTFALFDLVYSLLLLGSVLSINLALRI